jgi:hypothetical protein
MRATRKTRTSRGTWAILMAGVMALCAGAGCGEDDFENRPRPPVAVELTGVIQEDKVTVSPSRVGAGPVLITISNQTKAAHTVTLEGETIRERVGPVNPLDTATIQKTLKRGSYEVSAGSQRAVSREIEPAQLSIGKPRKSSSDELLLP